MAEEGTAWEAVLLDGIMGSKGVSAFYVAPNTAILYSAQKKTALRDKEAYSSQLGKKQLVGTTPNPGAAWHL